MDIRPRMTPQQLISLVIDPEFRSAGWNLSDIDRNPNFTPEAKMQARRAIPYRAHIDSASIIMSEEDINCEWNTASYVPPARGDHDPRFVLLVRNPNIPIETADHIMSPVMRTACLNRLISARSQYVSFPCICENPNITYDIAVRELRRDMKHSCSDSARALSRNLLQYHHVRWRLRSWLIGMGFAPIVLIDLIVDYAGPSDCHRLRPVGEYVIADHSCEECGRRIEDPDAHYCMWCCSGHAPDAADDFMGFFASRAKNIAN